MEWNKNILGPDPALITENVSITPPLFYGVIGQQSDLINNDFMHAGGNIVSVYFDCIQTATLFTQKIRLRSSTDNANRMRAGVYTKTGADSGNALSLSADIITFDTSVQTLTFTQNKSINSGTGYWFTYQAEADWFFFYDSSAINQYGFLGSAAFGAFPASFSGVSTFPNIIQAWGDYVY
jgi:hypothetical protein